MSNIEKSRQNKNFGNFRVDPITGRGTIYLSPDTSNKSDFFIQMCKSFLHTRVEMAKKGTLKIESLVALEKGLGKSSEDVNESDFERFDRAIKLYLFDGRIPSGLDSNTRSVILESIESVREIYKNRENIRSDDIDGNLLFLVESFIPTKRETSLASNSSVSVKESKFETWYPLVFLLVLLGMCSLPILIPV